MSFIKPWPSANNYNTYNTITKHIIQSITKGSAYQSLSFEIQLAYLTAKLTKSSPTEAGL